MRAKRISLRLSYRKSSMTSVTKTWFMPAFPWRVTITNGIFELLGSPGYYLRKGNEFINATALDGSSLPAYFPESSDPKSAQMRDLWGPPPISIHFPDPGRIPQPSRVDG